MAGICWDARYFVICIVFLIVLNVFFPFYRGRMRDHKGIQSVDRGRIFQGSIK